MGVLLAIGCRGSAEKVAPWVGGLRPAAEGVEADEKAPREVCTRWVRVDLPWAGASSVDVLRELVTIEEAVSRVGSVHTVVARAESGSGSVFVGFSPGEIEVQAAAVQAAVRQVSQTVPQDAHPPLVRVMRASGEGVVIAVSSDRELEVVESVAEQLEAHVERERGIDRVVRYRNGERVLFVRTAPSRLQAMGVSAHSVAEALRRGAIGAGSASNEAGASDGLTIRGMTVARSRGIDIDTLGELTLRMVEGEAVRISDVATVAEGRAGRASVRYRGRPAVAIVVWGDLADTVVDAVYTWKPQVPPAVTVDIVGVLRPRGCRHPWGNVSDEGNLIVLGADQGGRDAASRLDGSSPDGLWMFGQPDVYETLGRVRDVQWIGSAQAPAPDLLELFGAALVRRAGPHDETIAFTLVGPDANVLRATAEPVVEALRGHGLLVVEPAIRSVIDVTPTSAARELGLRERDVTQALRWRAGGEDLGIEANGLPVWLQVAEGDEPDLPDLAQTVVWLPDGGGQVPLGSVAQVELVQDEELMRVDGRPAYVVLVTSRSKASARATLERTLSEAELPTGVTAQVLEDAASSKP